MNVVQFSVEPLLRVAQAFPAAPRLMAELGRLLANPNSDLTEITSRLKNDPVIAARLLRIANSAAFAQAGRIASVDDAVALIGFKGVYRLVGAVAVDQFSQWTYPLYGFNGRRLRENALLVAILMEEFAVTSDGPHKSAYTAGLFRSIGRLALEKLGAEGAGIEPFSNFPLGDLVAWEKHNFGVAGNEATASILHHWRFPDELSASIAEHYLPDQSSPVLAHLLNLAASIADRLNYGLPGEHRYWSESPAHYERAGVDPTTAESRIAHAALTFARLNRAFN